MHTIRIYNSHTTVLLAGPLAAPPFGAARLLDGGPENTRLDLALSGSPQQMADGLQALGRALDAPAWLEVTPTEGGETWQTPLSAWALRRAADGTQDRHLNLTRADFWEGSLRSLPLNDTLQPVTLTNHSDAHSGHSHSAAIRAADCAGDLPAPLRLEIGVPAGGADPLGNARLALDAGADGPTLQAEDAFCPITSSTRSDAACSGGACRNLTWSSNDETAVLRWSLDSAALAACAGRAFRPLLRLTGLNLLSGLDFHLRLAYSGMLLADENGCARAALNTSLVELPPIFLPPFAPAGMPLQALELWLYARRSGGAAVELDDLLLLPAANWRSLQAAVSVPPGCTLADSSVEPYAYTVSAAGQALASHNAGGELLLAPGLDQRLALLAVDSPPGMSLTLLASYWPRRRVL